MEFCMICKRFQDKPNTHQGFLDDKQKSPDNEQIFRKLTV
ncbi:hypothetical protein C900_05914 [Fulvivirga imtechensis AK7]|uniref:Uncharacterized protein n=1 Tax=Fulvivirga imtechensis AK7 TaxID=1237149 RepID=L8JIM6_9BACT|nr:hypothetical protein C900_05914 [Fulvivirga imtechensis AK7]